ncbi:MAG: hypothetical protein WD623_11215 [Marinobacter sp.]|uniref:hypothetical protein n=1 Tax=Marinobacter sp. TaxID=50741 RepID=UPI0034A04C47
MKIRITPLHIYFGFLTIIGILLLSNLAGIALAHFTIHDHAWGLISLFDFRTERSIPAFYSSLAILISALLLFTIGRRHWQAGERAVAWIFLGFIFVFLSFDEIASFHERLGDPAQEYFQTSGFLHFAWVIPGVVAILIVGLLYIPFLLRLPRRTAAIFIGAGTLFVGGAIGVEMIGGWYYESNGATSIYGIIYTLEELMEKLGIATFIYGLLDYMTRRFGSIQTQILSPAQFNHESKDRQ